MSAPRSLSAIDAEIQAVDRRVAVAVLNDAPQTTRTRLFYERIHLVREWKRATEVGDPERRRGSDRRRHSAGLRDANGAPSVPSSRYGRSEPSL